MLTSSVRSICDRFPCARSPGPPRKGAARVRGAGPPSSVRGLRAAEMSVNSEPSCQRPEYVLPRNTVLPDFTGITPLVGGVPGALRAGRCVCDSLWPDKPSTKSQEPTLQGRVYKACYSSLAVRQAKERYGCAVVVCCSLFLQGLRASADAALTDPSGRQQGARPGSAFNVSALGLRAPCISLRRF